MGNNQNLSKAELKAQRIEELLDSCKNEVLKQIIGPFGLTPAMFNDRDGGAVTTTNNFKKGIVANEEDAKRYSRWQENLKSVDRDPYDAELRAKRKVMFQRDGPIISSYTGKELPRDGRTHLDHVVPVSTIEKDPHLILNMTKEQRISIANNSKNLVPTESNINQSMGDKDKKTWAEFSSKKEPDKTNAERFGIDTERLEKTTKTSERYIKIEAGKAQFTKQAPELLITGVEAAGRNALRQATGLLLHELVSGSYIEIKRITKEPDLKENFIDHLIEALKNVAERIEKKLRHIFDSIISGGIQGFISNFLTYLINCFVTTSAKIVTIIREGMTGLWKAISLLIRPPEGMTRAEAVREATKIIAAVVTTGLGMFFEKSVEAFILSVPLLAPLAGVIAPAVTAILTGIMTALVVFGIDRFFDWLNETGTEMITAQEKSLEASVGLFEPMAQMLQAQFDSSKKYQVCIVQYSKIEADLLRSTTHIENAIVYADCALLSGEATKQHFLDMQKKDEELETLLLEYQQNKKEQ